MRISMLRSSKFLFSSFTNRSAETPNLLKWLGPSKRFHSSTYMRSAKRSSIPVVTENTPTPNSWKPYLIPIAGLTGFGSLVLFFHYNDERRAIPKGQEVKFERSANQGPIIGGPFSLINTEGQTITQNTLLGNWVLMYFGYTSSPDVGPAEIQKMAKAVDILESKEGIKILPTFVTIDPQRDTPSHLRTYLKEFDTRIMGLTGPVNAIRQMAREYRVFFRKVDDEGDDYLVESSHNMYLINQKMEVVRCFGVEYNAEELSEAIVKELRK